MESTTQIAAEPHAVPFHAPVARPGARRTLRRLEQAAVATSALVSVLCIVVAVQPSRWGRAPTSSTPVGWQRPRPAPANELLGKEPPGQPSKYCIPMAGNPLQSDH